MTYNSAYPTSADPVVAATLQGNFAAIENGTVNHKQLTLDKQGAAPSGVTDKVILYGIEDTQTEAYAKGADGTAIQLTQDGRMGSATTPTTVQNIKYGAGTASYGLGQMFTAWAYHDGTAGVTPTADFEMGTVARTNAADAATNGTFKFTFDTPMANANYSILGTPDNSVNNNARMMIVKARDVNYFVISLVDETGSLVNGLPFSVVVFGGR